MDEEHAFLNDAWAVFHSVITYQMCLKVSVVPFDLERHPLPEAQVNLPNLQRQARP